jgi:glycosyltransferase involved in cell wall biosynthesis
MRVVHLSWTDISGGAARAAWRVHRSVSLADDVRSSMVVGARHSQSPDVTEFRPRRTLRQRLAHRVRVAALRRERDRANRTRPEGFEPFADDRTVHGSEIGVQVPPADIYHLHQITGFVHYDALPRLAARAPIVWTLHEMSPFTGGCPYSYDCERFTQRCGTCPQLGSNSERDLSDQVWTRKQAVYHRIDPARMHIVGASQWIAGEAKRSGLLSRYPISVIPYGLDTEVFRPMPEARRLLDAFGVRPSARVVLFVADHATNPRKGFDLLDAALGSLQHLDTALVSLGRGESPALKARLPHVHLGAMTEDRLIAAIYSLADVFVVPSLQDNLPNTVLEAMACGTPVVAFRVGGIPEMVRDGSSGRLVAPGDVAGLARALDSLLADDRQRACMGRAARQIAEREYTYARQCERYLRIYDSLTHTTIARSVESA